MTSDFELERAAARAKALRGGVSGEFVTPDPDAPKRPPTPSDVLGPRAAEDKTKRRRKLDDAEEDALRG